MNFSIFRSYAEKFLKQIIKLSESIEFISIGFQNRSFFETSFVKSKYNSIVLWCKQLRKFPKRDYYFLQEKWNSRFSYWNRLKFANIIRQFMFVIRDCTGDYGICPAGLISCTCMNTWKTIHVALQHGACAERYI